MDKWAVIILPTVRYLGGNQARGKSLLGLYIDPTRECIDSRNIRGSYTLSPFRIRPAIQLPHVIARQARAAGMAALHLQREASFRVYLRHSAKRHDPAYYGKFKSWLV